MSACTYQDGWLCVPYAGHDLAAVHIAVGEGRAPAEEAWRPAYHDTPAGVVKVRLPEPPRRQHVWLRVNGHVVRVR